jgi:dATP/dGTP diphosphohydrolase
MPEYDPQEQQDILQAFRQMLLPVVADGGRKRAANGKPSWKVDKGHVDALNRHLARWERGELVDEDSGAHPLVHAAFRCLAIAGQESDRDWC